MWKGSTSWKDFGIVATVKNYRNEYGNILEESKKDKELHGIMRIDGWS